jgi:hypothetical protein
MQVCTAGGAQRKVIGVSVLNANSLILEYRDCIRKKLYQSLFSKVLALC